MNLDPALPRQLLATVPTLRTFAMSLCGNIAGADDLVQETLLRALTHINSFQPGTNLSAWLITILRNKYFEEYRKRRREVEDVDGLHAEALVSPPEQASRVEFSELRAALARLPDEQRRALILVGASDYSYAEAAVICGCPAGTIKSRLHRARMRLADLLAIDSADHFGTGPARHMASAGNRASPRTHISLVGALPNASRQPPSEASAQHLQSTSNAQVFT